MAIEPKDAPSSSTTKHLDIADKTAEKTVQNEPIGGDGISTAFGNQTPVGITQVISLFSSNGLTFTDNELNVSFPNFRLKMWLLNQKMHRRAQRQHNRISQLLKIC